ncbi:hypothetical protein [Actinomadura livida]|uniref:Uncharacterized protein n=1 Tax=Actinomadura livida TaxID=79909 RepID=A0A7W7IDR6_9ACTN|nr:MULTISPECIES: hypothetical protein [Actinomadura]MBB4775242.1 hypothetical protein [Actinomadura catellatispora]GGT88884.1 hypothetical protein GCM10010208_09560 [Actinomadura livida]
MSVTTTAPAKSVTTTAPVRPLVIGGPTAAVAAVIVIPVVARRLSA